MRDPAELYFYGMGPVCGVAADNALANRSIAACTVKGGGETQSPGSDAVYVTY